MLRGCATLALVVVVMGAACSGDDDSAAVDVSSTTGLETTTSGAASESSERVPFPGLPEPDESSFEFVANDGASDVLIGTDVTGELVCLRVQQDEYGGSTSCSEGPRLGGPYAIPFTLASADAMTSVLLLTDSWAEAASDAIAAGELPRSLRVVDDVLLLGDLTAGQPGEELVVVSDDGSELRILLPTAAAPVDLEIDRGEPALVGVPKLREKLENLAEAQGQTFEELLATYSLTLEELEALFDEVKANDRDMTMGEFVDGAFDMSRINAAR